MSVVFKITPVTKHGVRWHCSAKKSYRCDLLVVGGGSGGCSVAWRFARRLPKKCIILLEPSKTHYYQPGFTLVGGGIQKLRHYQRPEQRFVPPSVKWLQDAAENFDPCENLVYTRNGDKIHYEFMVVAVGVKNDYDKITGLQRALDDPCSSVSTIYDPKYCTKAWDTIQEFTGGHAVFTFPSVAGKCPGASLKIMYLAHHWWTKNKLIDKTCITFNTGGEALLGIPKYGNALRKITLSKSIVPNYGADLVEISPKGALFVGTCGESVSFPYKLLHVTPPMSPPPCLLRCEALTNKTGYLEVDQFTMQHRKFPNVFGLGDCTSTPNAKTAAAVAPQSYVLERNLSNFMEGKQLSAKYNGYGACPVITSYNKVMLAEFKYDKKVWETFPFDQSKERRLMFQMNKHFMPFLYWNYLLKGKWNGPGTVRKIINPFGL